MIKKVPKASGELRINSAKFRIVNDCGQMNIGQISPVIRITREHRIIGKTEYQIAFTIASRFQCALHWTLAAGKKVLKFLTEVPPMC